MTSEQVKWPLTGGKRPRDNLWDSIDAGVIAKIKEHPFITGIIDGSLKEDTFRKYIVQDHKYLDVFSRMLNSLAAKAPGAHEATVFTKSALSVYEVETGLHQKLLKEWEVSMDQVEEAEMQPACLLYTSYLSNVVQSKPFHEGLAAVLPCYWIYQHVGSFLKEKGSQNAKYQAWIDLYGGEEFEATVLQVLQMMDQVAAGLSAEQWVACKQHFLMTSKMEYMFWDGPYRGEVWPC